jgi:hypothetical protein
MARIIYGVIMIILGLTGNFALRGTNSPTALVVIGFIMVIVGIIQMASNANKNEDVLVVAKNENRVSPNPVQVTQKKEITPSIDLDEETKQTIRKMCKSDAIVYCREKFNVSIKEAKLMFNVATA